MTSRTSIALRLAFILLSGFGAMYLIFQSDFWLLGIWTLLFCIIGFISLIRYLERTQKELYNFLEAIKQEDFSQSSFSSGKSKKYNFNRLYKDIADLFHQLKSKQASEHILLQTVMEHTNVAIVVFDESGVVQMSNKAVRDLFHVPHFRKLNRLFQKHPELAKKVNKESQNNFTYKMMLEGNVITLAIKKSYFKIRASTFTIVSFQDIRQELEEKELDSWQKLIRVLTHEIMNTAIPIATLSNVISQIMVDDNQQIHKQLSEESKNDIFKGLQTIENRSKGLTQFVESYKHLTRLKPIKLKKTNLKDIISDVIALLRPKLSDQKVHLVYEGSDIYFQVDKELFSQVIINLVLNALEAIGEGNNGQITIETSNVEERTLLTISDNGPGITPDVLEDIFVPFFTTKKEGSGIGLSLSRQIIRMHQGKIAVKSEAGSGTQVSIEI